MLTLHTFLLEKVTMTVHLLSFTTHIMWCSERNQESILLHIYFYVVLELKLGQIKIHSDYHTIEEINSTH